MPEMDPPMPGSDADPADLHNLAQDLVADPTKPWLQEPDAEDPAPPEERLEKEPTKVKVQGGPQ